MELARFLELTEQILYKGQKCVETRRYDWRNGFKPVPEGYIYVSVWINVSDRDTGNPTKVENGSLWSLNEIEGLNEHAMIATIRDNIVSLELHETNEMFMVNGVRVFDPHNEVEISKSESKQEAA